MYELSASSTLAAIAGSAAASRIEPTPASARWRGAPSGSVVVGVSGAAQNAAAAICVNGRLQAFCEQERVSRIRRAGVEPGKLPDEAIDTVLGLAHLRRSDIQTIAAAEDCLTAADGVATRRFPHHFAHAATAFLTSPFAESTILVCDHHSDPPLSVWSGRGQQITAVPWARQGAGLAELYSTCARIFGCRAGAEHGLEALARIGSGAAAERLSPYFRYADGSLRVGAGWQEFVRDWLAEGRSDALASRAHVASSVQAKLGEILCLLLAEVKRASDAVNICLAGGLFFNTYFNTAVHQSGLFDRVFVPPNPGNAGLAAGSALAAAAEHGAMCARMETSPFLGPGYSLEEIKATLDNCKLRYDCLHERELVDTTVDALCRGLTVGWFQGRMEWGHRALGHRSILASPLSPYALDNLNVFLKQREAYRAYGLSVREEDASRFFDGPPRSPYMEFEYRVTAPGVLDGVLPAGTTRLRVQTIGETPQRFRSLHEAFGKATGTGVLVNTSFNGFNEPIVCSPRDAIRVFFGTGLDLLVMDRFVIRK